MFPEIFTMSFALKLLTELGHIGLAANGLSLLLLLVIKNRSAVYDGQTSYGLEPVLTLVGGISLTSILAIPTLYIAGHWTDFTTVLMGISLAVMGLNHWLMEEKGVSPYRIGGRLTLAGMLTLLITMAIWIIASAIQRYS